MGPQKHYCVREAAEYPVADFFRNDKGILVHRLGAKGNWHYAATGEPLEVHSNPFTVRIPVNEALNRSKSGLRKE
jgi:hypothetical protein